MREIILSDGSLTQVSDEDWIWAAGYNWSRNGSGYVTGRVDGPVKSLHSCIAERMGLHCKEVDHRDRNRNNNQRSNIRPATGSQNKANSSIRCDSTTGFRGVYLDRRWNRYVARIRVEGRSISLGYFDTSIEAARAYNDAAIKYFGEFACLNAV